MASSVWIKLSLFLYVMSVSQTIEGKKFHRTSLSNHPFRSGRHSGFSKGNFLEVNKKAHGFTKKSVAPFHVEGNPLVHLSVVAPKRESQGDNAPAAAQAQRGSFKIDDSGVIGGGTYEINEDGVDVDINLKIKKPAQEPKPQGPPPGEITLPQPSAPKLCPMPCPQPGQPSPAKPEGSQAKPVPAEQPGSVPSPSGPASPKPGTTPPPLEPASSKPGSPTTPVVIGGSPHEAPTPVPGTEAGPTTPKPETTQPTPAAGGEAGSDFATEGLNEHNKFRTVHGVPLLTLNAEMSQEAEAYAQKIAQMGNLQHASREERKGYGENLSMGCSSNKGGQTATEAVTNWYNEICSPGYTFGSDSGGGGTGHFTQVVWRESKELGMGKAEGEKNGLQCTYIVGRYNPAGNMMGAYADNVPKGSFDQSYCSNIQKKRSNIVWKTTS